MPRQMVSPTISEISGVDHPAHLREGWLLMKDASPETADLLARAEALAKGIDPASLTHKGKDMPELSEEAREALPQEAQDFIKSLEDHVASLTEKVEKSAPVPTEDELFEKALAELPEPVRKALIARQAEAAENKAIAKALWDEREDSRFEEMAKSLVHVPGVGAGFGAVLRKAAGPTKDTEAAFQPIFDVLKAADAAIAESNLFSENGVSATAPAGSAREEIEKAAAALRESDKDLTHEMAIAKAAADNPDLYARYRREYTASQREA